MSKQCHCGRALHPDHFKAEKYADDMHAQHAIRCCGCVDSYLFDAPGCDECAEAGKASGEQAEWEPVQ